MCIICNVNYGCGHRQLKTFPCTQAFIGCGGMFQGGTLNWESATCPYCQAGAFFRSFVFGAQDIFASPNAFPVSNVFSMPTRGYQSWGASDYSSADEDEGQSQLRFTDISDESSEDEEEIQSQSLFPMITASVGGSQSHQDQTAVEKAKVGNALQKYLETFPHSLEIIPTPGTGLLCGFAAVILSMEAMDPDLARPTVEELQVAFKSLQNAEFGLHNENFFHVDQVGAALYVWGTQYDMNLQVGYVPDGQPPQLVPHPNDEPTIVVFMHHVPGHFSGLRPLKAVNFENFSKIGAVDEQNVCNICIKSVEDGLGDEMICD